MKKIYLPLLVLVIVGIGGYFLLNRGQVSPETSSEPLTVNFQAGEAQNFQKGQKAPDITLTTLFAFEGKTYKLSDFEGKAVVLDFWAAWCPYCVEEMPALQTAQDKYADKLKVIGIHRTDTEDRDVGGNFAIKRGVSYLLVQDKDGSLYKAAGGFGMPVAVFIDSQGIVQDVKSGPKTVEEIEEKIAALLQE